MQIPQLLTNLFEKNPSESVWAIAIVAVIGIISICSLVTKFLQMGTVWMNGWPPSHLDLNGNFAGSGDDDDEEEEEEEEEDDDDEIRDLQTEVEWLRAHAQRQNSINSTLVDVVQRLNAALEVQARNNPSWAAAAGRARAGGPVGVPGVDQGMMTEQALRNAQTVRGMGDSWRAAGAAAGARLVGALTNTGTPGPDQQVTGGQTRPTSHPAADEVTRMRRISDRLSEISGIIPGPERSRPDTPASTPEPEIRPQPVQISESVNATDLDLGTETTNDTEAIAGEPREGGAELAPISDEAVQEKSH